MKNENDKAGAMLLGALLVVGAVFWLVAAIFSIAAITKLCWLFLLG